ncbi:metal-dependent transcriptional regulator [Leekyejoonella antrihumi]|nr:metal-dependent transcriptional regulator [Leekyejoonella antrihumi]
MSKPAKSDLSSTAEDYVKAIWSAREWGGEPTSITALAERFGTTRATVSETIKRLTARGLVTHEPYKEIALTPTGELEALLMVRRHRLLETFLVTTLGYGWDEVHDEAESLEHAASTRMIDRIDDVLGHPDHDPHGDPIPSRDGVIRHPASAVSLAEAAPGDYCIVRISDSDSDRLVYFDEQGLLPRSPINVQSQDDRAGTTTVVTAHGNLVALAGDATRAIMLVPTPH